MLRAFQQPKPMNNLFSVRLRLILTDFLILFYDILLCSSSRFDPSAMMLLEDA